jgi:hypothetical protein
LERKYFTQLIRLRLRLGYKKLIRNSSNKPKETRAGALLCPTCCVEYLEIEFDMEVEEIVLHKIKALRCPECEEELFTPLQYAIIKKRIDDSKAP